MNPNSEYTDTPTLSIRQQIFKLLDKNPILKPKELCKLIGLNYYLYRDTIQNYKQQWKSEYKNRQALKCLSFHNTRGWIYALKVFDRVEAVCRGWGSTMARNRMLLWKDLKLGRLEWFLTGRINIWVKKPASWGRVKQLLANAFFATGLLTDIQIFDLWANSARFKGAHLVYDTGVRLPYVKIDLLKDSNGVVAKLGDVTHPTSLELEFHYPDFEERNERLLEQVSKALELNSQQIQQFSQFLQDLSQPRKPSKDVNNMVI